MIAKSLHLNNGNGRNGRIRTCDPLTPSQVNEVKIDKIFNDLGQLDCKIRVVSAPVCIAVTADSAKCFATNQGGV